MVGDIYLGELDQPERFGGSRSPLVGTRGGVKVCVCPLYLAPHLLIVAQTGGGKTTLLRVMNVDLLQDSLPKVILLGDGKRIGSFRMFERESGVKFANDADDIRGMVADTYDELGRRVKAFDNYREHAAKTRSSREWKAPPPLFLEIDEYIGWLLLLKDDVRDEVVSELGLICFQGREVDMHFVAAMQTCHANAFNAGLSSVMKMNMDGRIGIPGAKGFTDLQSRMLYDESTTKDRIPPVEGGGLIKVGAQEAGFEVPWLPDPTSPDARKLSREELSRVWGALPSGGTRQRWVEQLDPGGLEG